MTLSGPPPTIPAIPDLPRDEAEQDIRFVFRVPEGGPDIEGDDFAKAVVDFVLAVKAVGVKEVYAESTVKVHVEQESSEGTFNGDDVVAWYNSQQDPAPTPDPAPAPDPAPQPDPAPSDTPSAPADPAPAADPAATTTDPNPAPLVTDAAAEGPREDPAAPAA